MRRFPTVSLSDSAPSGRRRDSKSPPKKKGLKSIFESKTPPNRKNELIPPFVSTSRSWDKDLHINQFSSALSLQQKDFFDFDEQPPETTIKSKIKEEEDQKSFREKILLKKLPSLQEEKISSASTLSEYFCKSPRFTKAPDSARSHSPSPPYFSVQADYDSPSSSSSSPPSKLPFRRSPLSSSSSGAFVVPSSSSSPFVALSPRLKSIFSNQSSSPPSPSLSSFEEEEESECQFRCDSYLDILNYLVGLSPEKIKDFFVGFEQSFFDIDQFKLLETMKEMIITKEGEEQQNEKKEQIIQIVLSWRKILTPFYQTFNPLLSKAIEEFLDSFESTPFESTLSWKGRMSLSSCGTSRHVAQMLTSMMFQRYKDLRSHEFYDGFWQKEEKYIRSPNIMAMSEIFNRISSMVVESILFCESENRSQNLMLMIKLATQLFKLRNFEGWGAVISGLNQSSIQRLKPLWKLLNSRYKKRFKLFEEMLSPDSNFKNYQNLLHSSEPPLLPWFAPKLRELRYLYDGNQAKTEEGFVSLPYLMKIGSSINSFLQYQQFWYDFPHSPDNTLLLKFLQKRSISEEICYKQSLSLLEKG